MKLELKEPVLADDFLHVTNLRKQLAIKGAKNEALENHSSGIKASVCRL